MIHIGVNATRTTAEMWGDTHFARLLSVAFRRNGYEAEIFFRGQLPDFDSSARNVVLQICGPHVHEPFPNVPNLLWMISLPGFVSRDMLARYQQVFVASRSIAKWLELKSVPGSYLAQATDPDLFHPSRADRQQKPLPVVFVGGMGDRAERRHVVEAIKAGFEVHVWGPGWADAIPQQLWHGTRLSFDSLPGIYGRAAVILNSHMDSMSSNGMMSNRTYDGYASGATVISDRIPGFEATELPDLVQVNNGPELLAALERALAAGPPSYSERLRRNSEIVGTNDFDHRARTIIARIEALCQQGSVAAPAFQVASSRAAAALTLTRPAQSSAHQDQAMRHAALEIIRIAGTLATNPHPRITFSAPSEEEGVIHPLMRSQRRIQEIAQTATRDDHLNDVDALVEKARRVSEAFDDKGNPDPAFLDLRHRDAIMVRLMRNEPLWPHEPDDHTRDNQKTHLRLHPRRQSVEKQRSIGVFLHLFYEDLAPTFAARLSMIRARHQLYVSTDTDAKASRIARSLPDAQIHVFPNRGRDIFPKIFGFADAHSAHDIVLHLHGKRSVHSDALSDWLTHILDCLIPSEAEVNRILSLFNAIPSLGLVTPLAYRPLLGAAHWAANREIAEELAFRMGLKQPLPDNARLRFPVGSMFWARVKALQPLLDLGLKQSHFPPETGQVDGTLAHAIERMIGVTSAATGHKILPVAGHSSRMHRGFQKLYKSNKEIRDALDAGEFDG